MSVTGMNAYANDVAGADVVQVQLGQRFVYEMRRAVSGGGGSRENV
jgi:hypothetical protein